jgi:hypothetical protein
MKSANQEQAVVVAPPQTPAPVQQSPDNIMAVIARAAADPNVDVGKMERLLAMIREEDKRVAEQLFNAAMARAQAEMPLILKKATNPSTNSKFAKLEAIAKAILPVVEKHNFSLQFSEDDSPKPEKIRVVCKVSHAADLNGKQYSHSEIFHMDLSPDDTGAKGSPTKTKIHGEGSTFSYGRRYLTCMIFNLTIIGEDDDGTQGHRPRTTTGRVATATTKEWFLKEILILGEPLVKSYYEQTGILSPDQKLSEIALDKVPTSKTELAALVVKINKFKETGNV